MRINKLLLLASCLLLLCLSSQAWAVNWCEHVNVKACYLFKDGSGTTLTDETGTNNGSIQNSPSWTSVSGANAPSYARGALEFNGSNQYINCGTDESLNLTNPSGVAWMYSPDTWGTENLETILSKQKGSTPYNDLDFRESNASSTGQIETSITTNGSDRDECVGPSLIPSEEWVHIAFTYNGTDINVYVNGIANTCTHSSGGDMVYEDAQNLNIARNTTYSRYFNGSLTEIALFNTGLSSTDINDIMDDGLVQTASVAYFPFKQFNHGIMTGVF